MQTVRKIGFGFRSLGRTWDLIRRTSHVYNMYDKSNSNWTITNTAKVRKGGLSKNAATALLTVVTTKAAEMWSVTVRDVAEIYRRFGESTIFIFRVQQSKNGLLSRWTCYALRRVVSYLSIDMVYSRRRESKTVTDIHAFPMAQQPLVGHGRLIMEASLSHSDTVHPVGLFWTRDRSMARTFSWQHTHTQDRHPCRRRDSNS